MRIDKAGVAVVVLALGLDQIGLEAPVERFDVHLDVIDHRVPVRSLLLIDVPTLLCHVSPRLGQDSSIVHQLLRDATNIYAGATEAPLGASGRRFNIVGKGDAKTHTSCVPGA